MRKLLLATAFVIASASAQAQSIDIGSILSANGVSLGKGGQPQAGQQGGGAPGLGQGAGSQGGQSAAAQGQGQGQGQGQQQGQGQSQRQAGRAKQPRESAQETRARNIAAKYGISW